MKFNISVIKSEKTTRQGPKSSYIQLELTFKRLDSGKIESKKLMSFMQPAQVYQALVEAKMDEQFTITSEKNEKTTYWDWTEAVAAAPGGASTSAATPASKGGSTAWADDRAVTQVYIIKQSALKAAVDLLTVGAKVPPSTDLILKQAQEFVDWVLGKVPETALVDMENDTPD